MSSSAAGACGGSGASQPAAGAGARESRATRSPCDRRDCVVARAPPVRSFPAAARGADPRRGARSCRTRWRAGHAARLAYGTQARPTTSFDSFEGPRRTHRPPGTPTVDLAGPFAPARTPGASSPVTGRSTQAGRAGRSLKARSRGLRPPFSPEGHEAARARPRRPRRQEHPASRRRRRRRAPTCRSEPLRARARPNRCSRRARRSPGAAPSRPRLSGPFLARRPWVLVVDEDDTVADENLILDLDPGADEGMALDLASPPHCTSLWISTNGPITDSSPMLQP